ncbi:hypothetical protein P879_06487 [Paragonimus westermani]|uniref:Dymeclin n=1 Tax=Paragonimus westermani TaxID=34504 RepID=A0A8T0DGE9_9TREM|nr:hypothetical protein P879_06487 [Paragonimus westermani]
MGGRITTLPVASAHDYLKKYVGKEYISPSDPFWKEFLSFSGLSESEYNALENIEEMDSSILHEFRKHNLKSRQLSSLMQFIVSHVTELLGSVVQPDAIYDKSLLSIVQNALLVFRISAKYLVERTSEHRFVMHLKDDSGEDSSLSLLECFFQVLFRLLLEVPVKDETYGLHCETLMTILVLLARQMHNDLSCPLPRVYVYLMWGKAASLAPAIVHRLLTNFADNIPVPPGLHNRSNQSSFIWRAASSLAGGIWTVVTLGYGGRGQTQVNSTSKAAFSATPTTLMNSVTDHTKPTSDTVVTDLVTSESMVLSGLPQDCHLLADLSALLLLVLTTQAGSILRCTRILQELGINSQTPSLNPYRVALFSMRDINDLEVSPPPKPVNGVGSTDPKPRLSNANLKGVTSLINPDVTEFPVDFVAIRDTAAHTLHQDSSTLLLYLLIHRNPHFQAFLLDKRNYDKLLLPLLNILYRSPADSSHLVYMALIIILILTENERFGEEIHNSLIHWVKWSPNRQLSSISRGSLVILVLIRTIRYHLNQLKDRYLHVNILAALANLSAKVTNMHPYVSDAFLW